MDAPVQTKIPLPMEKIEAICKKWRITRLELFGSILRDDWKPESSDVDLLISLDPGVRMTIDTLLGMDDDFATLFGRRVDVVLRRNIERSDNPYRRHEILSSARAIYDAA